MAINPLNALKLLNPNDRVPKPVQRERLDICLNRCDKSELGICKVCYCFLAGKTAIASEHCPEHKWSVYPVDNNTDDQ
nr:hypothetical protein 33 [bacterium]